MQDPLFSRPWFRAKFFKLLANKLPAPTHPSGSVPPAPRRILVLLPVLLGDYLVSTPLLAGIRKARPKAEIAVMVTHVSQRLASVDPNVDRVLVYHKLPKWFGSIISIIRYRPDVIVFPKGHPATTESIIMALTRAKVRIGLHHPHHDPLLTHIVEHDWENEHRTEALIRLLEPFGVDTAYVSRRLTIGEDEESEAWAEHILEKETEARPLITINVSASRASRRWTLEGWRSLIQQLLQDKPAARFYVLGTPEDQEMCMALATEFPEVHTVATRSLLDAVAIIARSSFLITNDTGIVQAAAARGISMVVLYNGDHEVAIRFAPQSVVHKLLLAPRKQTVAAIPAEKVLNATKALMKELGVS